ncbi:terminase small subunit [Mycobacterium phage Indlulamithi]|uniref:Uncharacterized protein n=1 Tax=Mycobacterium phage Indlulamithi TaxID=2656582 RepID=A0A649VCU4_9CAUD|nr:terminase small subunit [Mycobacterium phage Indlulamithi]QGJ90147.1 hypothetical protein PBI_INDLULAMITHI_110 [Mycobacterium phage Indlulamithi]
MSAPVKFVGNPTGPMKFIKELGREVPTFVEKPGGKTKALRHHVPLECRGDYRPSDLANFDPEFNYRTDPFGRVLCYAYTKAGERCSKRAVNRYPRCDIHGGRIHPLDKIAPKSGADQAVSRYQLFKAGQIGVDDLDDEELATCGFRASDGRIYKPRNVPREMAQAFTKAIYERAQEQLRALTVDAVQTLGDIMKNKSVEPDVRLKSALSIIERNLGKTPQAVVLSTEKPFEEIFDDIEHGSREDYRRSKAIESERIIEAEIVPDPGRNRPDFADADESRSGSDGTDRGSVGGEQDSVQGSDAGQSDADESAGGFVNPRMYERNEAVLAQVVERKPFEYDLSDHSEDVKKATQKRYVARALGEDIIEGTGPYETEEIPLPDGGRIIKNVDPERPKPKSDKDSRAKSRKRFTLDDF